MSTFKKSVGRVFFDKRVGRIVSPGPSYSILRYPIRGTKRVGGEGEISVSGCINRGAGYSGTRSSSSKNKRKKEKE